MDYVIITRINNNGRCGLSSSAGGELWLSPGLDSPICGWQWLECRKHPEVELQFDLSQDGVQFRATLRPTARPGLVARLSRAMRGVR